VISSFSCISFLAFLTSRINLKMLSVFGVCCKGLRQVAPLRAVLRDRSPRASCMYLRRLCYDKF